ncbi:MAG: hypothetical protein ACE5GB_03890, partial [Acidimicrobiales bacterium]
YLLWTGLVPSAPGAVSVTEQLFERELGPIGRELVAMVGQIPAAADIPVGSIFPGRDADRSEEEPADPTDDPTDLGGGPGVGDDASVEEPA